MSSVLVGVVGGLLLVSAVACASSSSSSTQDAASSQGGSGSGGSETAAGGGASDATRPLQVRPLYYRGGGLPYEPIKDGDVLVVRMPPQGGRVLWVAAEVAGVTGSRVEMSGRLRSKTTGEIVAEELRTVTIEPTDDSSDSKSPLPRTLRNVPNLPVCPNYGDEEILGKPLELTVTVSDPSTDPPGLGVATLDVSLGCVDGLTNCPCECSLGYVLGLCGATDETPPDF